MYEDVHSQDCVTQENNRKMAFLLNGYWCTLWLYLVVAVGLLVSYG